MLRRSILELSSRRSVKRLPRQITSPWIAPSISTIKEFSTPSQGNVPPKHSSMGKQPGPKSNFSKLLLGSAVFAGAFLVAYQNGYMDQYVGKRQHKSVDSGKIVDDDKDIKDAEHLSEQIVYPKFGDPGISSPSMELKIHAERDSPYSEVLSETSSEKQHHLEDKLDVKSEASRLSSPQSDMVSQESTAFVEDKDLGQYNNSRASDNRTSDYETSSARIPEGESLMSETTVEPSKEVATNSQSITVPEEKEIKSISSPHPTTEETQKEVSQGIERSAPLLDEYHLRENVDNMAFLNSEHISKEKQALDSTSEELNDGQLSKDGKLILDFLQAIHAAEQRQAELDACIFSEEKRALKEKYENELRDLRARELMRIEEAAILDKELKREKIKAAIAVKSIQEKMEEKLRIELEQKEMELELKLEKVQELAKAELAAAIVNEKAAQIEKMAEANLHINALCMAFYARSEEASKFGSGPEPLEGFYVGVIVDRQMVLLLGDLRKEAFKKTNSSPVPSSAVLVAKREQVFGKRVFVTKAQFCDNGKIHDLMIDCDTISVNDPCLIIRVDGKTLLQVKRLRWKFRGNHTILVDGLAVEVFWDIHNWLFGTSSSVGNAVFMFKTCLSADKLWASQSLSDSSTLQWSFSQRFLDNKSQNLGFSLILYAWKHE